MTGKNHIPLGKKGSRTLNAPVETGYVAAADANEHEVAKTFGIPESFGRPLQVRAAPDRSVGKGPPGRPDRRLPG